MPSKIHDSELIKTHWHDIKKQILTHWKKLNRREVEQTGGNTEALKKLIQAKYQLNEFDTEYEKICGAFAKKSKKSLYGNKTSTEGDEKMKATKVEFNAPDDEDEEGMTNFDDMNADYSRLAVDEAQQEELLRPNLQGMEASDAQTTPMTENKLEKKENNKNITAPDDLKPNQDPHSAKREDITLGRSNSSANTTSQSALISSGANKKL